MTNKTSDLQSDYIFLQNFYKICSFLGLIPFLNKKFYLLHKLFCVIICISIIIHNYFCTIVKGDFLVILNGFSRYLYLIFIIFSIVIPTFFFKYKWEIFINTLYAMEKGIDSLTFGSRKIYRIRHRVLIFLILFISFRLINFYYFVLFLSFPENFLVMVLKLTFVVYSGIFSVLYWTTVLFLKSRYNYILSILREKSKNKKHFFLLANLVKIKSILKIGDIAVSNFNSVFGIQLFLLIGSNTLYIISSVVVTVRMGRVTIDSVQAFILAPATNTVSTRIVMKSVCTQ